MTHQSPNKNQEQEAFHTPITSAHSSRISAKPPSSLNLQHSPLSPPDNEAKKQKVSPDESLPQLHKKIDQLTNAMAALTDICSSNKLEIKNMLAVSSENSKRIEQLTKRTTENEQSLHFLSAQSDQQKTVTTDLQKNSTDMQQTIDNLKDELETLREDLKEERKMRDAQEATKRKQMLDITGIPKADSEPKDLLRKRVLDICDVLQVPMTMREIDDIHRKQNGEVIVLFSDRTARDKLFSKRRTPQLDTLTPSSFEHWPAAQRGKQKPHNGQVKGRGYLQEKSQKNEH